MTEHTAGTWWTVARLADIPAGQLHATTCAGQDLVLFADAHGEIHAVEDRCPHRRVPLSLGRVTAKGLQCAYHGWAFDGVTGQCTDIPNLDEDEAVPKNYKIRTFPVAQSAQWVHVWLGSGQPTTPPTSLITEPAADSGHALVSLSQTQYLDALFDGPDALLGLRCVKISNYFNGDVWAEADHMVLDRSAVWSHQALPAEFVADHPLVVRVSVPRLGGLVRVELMTAAEQALLTLELATYPHRRDTTALYWQTQVHAHNSAQGSVLWRLALALKRPMVQVLKQIDGARIAAMLAAPSHQAHALRAAAASVQH